MELEKEIEMLTKQIYHGEYGIAYTKLKDMLKDRKLTKKEKARVYLLISTIEKLTHRHTDALKSIRKAIYNTPKKDVLLNLQITLLKADIYLNLVRYNESLKIIDQAEFLINDNKKKLGKKLIESEAYFNFVKGVAFRVKGYPNEAKDFLKKGISLYEKTGNKQGLARSLRNLGLAYSDNGEVQEAIKYYKESYDASMSINNKRDSIHPLAYIGFIYWKLGNLDEGIKYLKQRLELSNNIKYPYGIFSSKYHLGNLYFLKGDIEESIKLLEETIEICDKEGDGKFKGLSSMVLGMCYKELGSLDKAENYLNNAQAIFKELDQEQFENEALVHQGDLLIQKGDIEKAIKILRKALMKFEELGNVYAVAQTQLYLGQVYMVDGDFDGALVNLKASLDYFEKSKSLIPKAQCLHRIGWVYWQAGKLKKANEYLTKSLSQSKAINNFSTIASSLLGLITVNIESDNKEKAELYLAELKAINRKYKIKTVSMETRLAQALIFKVSKNDRDKSRAEILFESIINEPTPNFSLTVIAILNLCELLIMNIKKSNEEDNLVKLKGIITKLYSIAKEQDLESLLAESYWLQSQLALIERDPKSAQKFLNLANKLIENSDQISMKRKLSFGKQIMDEQIPKILKLKDNEISISQLVDNLQLIESIKQINKNTSKKLQQTPRDKIILTRIFEFK